MTSAASVEVEPIWASLLAKALEGKDVKELLSNIGSGGGAPAGAAPAAGGAAAAAVGEAPKEEEKKEEEKEESDDDMVRLFLNLIFAQIHLIFLSLLHRALVSLTDLPFRICYSCFLYLCLHVHRPLPALYSCSLRLHAFKMICT